MLMLMKEVILTTTSRYLSFKLDILARADAHLRVVALVEMIELFDVRLLHYHAHFRALRTGVAIYLFTSRRQHART
jgi:hypothetical protein